MNAVDWVRVDAAAQESIDQSVLAGALDQGARRGAAAARQRLLVRRVVTVAAIVVLTAAGLVVRGLVHDEPRVGDPIVTGLAPTSGLTTGNEPVTITGTDLGGTTTVRFGDAEAPTLRVDSDTQLTVTTPPGVPGVVEVEVTSLLGTVSAGTFTYADIVTPPPPGPVVANVSPSSGPASGGVVVTLTGTDLGTVTDVTFGTEGASGIRLISATEITVTTPPGRPGPVDVVVTSPTGTDTVPGAYTYLMPAPTVTQVKPAEGRREGGEQVVIRGTGFDGATGVTFGGVEALKFSVDSSSQITATTPAGTAGEVEVAVITPAGTSGASSSARYTYTGPPPTVTSIDPTGECTDDGSDPKPVTLRGQGLADVTKVLFGDVPATSVERRSDNELVATPLAFTGVVEVTVESPFGRSAGGVMYARGSCQVE